MNATIEIKDVQGLIIKGYGSMRNVYYTLMHIENPMLAKQWLNEIAPKISDGDHSPVSVSLNLALTYHGLQALGLHDANLRNFGREFREGMVTPHRQRLLADFDSSDPVNWRWGGKAKNECEEKNIHMLLMVFGKDQETADEFYNELEKDFTQKGIRVIMKLDGQLNKDNKEHFGFRDGIAQPFMTEAGHTGNYHNIVSPGEFILGYKNQYGVYPETPLVSVPQGDMNLLANDECGSGLKNIGRNGTYLVFRQMEQKVEAFWKFMNENSKKEDGTIDEDASIKLASQMVGRWPSGTPLATCPENDPGELSDLDDFGYSQHDKDGTRCPFGAHIRRSNPRDVFEDNKPKLSTKLTNKHRILRRGRSYGEGLDFTGPSNHQPNGEVGLHFICLNASIENQFEFVQRTWSNNPKFHNLYNDPDPITGTLENKDGSVRQHFTVQDFPVNRCVENIPQFAIIRGGGYFFLPSMSAIKYLASL